MEQNGKCVIFSAPSGAGKTTIVHAMLNSIQQLAFSVSATSRDPRPNETDGKDYHFLRVEKFQEAILKEEFVEWEEVYTNNYYGTLKSEIERIWEEGRTVIFDVDVIGGLNLKQIFGDNALAIFVHPPSIDVLEQRLRNRSTETEEKIQQRMSKARTELDKAKKFDEILINDSLESAISEAKKLVKNFIKS
ncbi:guanylate kinase [Crocinitomicaceae bacterium]|jgi:guanylate kinase|nr:guanylate kinase [Crocinitomicaceae bacterium]MDC1403362.1 guanylate kinase [Crocinitomicaceae bacterium]